MLCPRCRIENPPGARSCLRCGYRLGGTEAPSPERQRLARRKSRLLAKMVDLPFSFYSILLAMNMPAPVASDLLSGAMIMVAAISIPVQFVMLTKEGQTIGKKVLRIRIVGQDTEQNEGFRTNVFLREIVNGLAYVILPYIIVDHLLIFTKNKRCVHDYMAGTKVVRDESNRTLALWLRESLKGARKALYPAEEE